MKKFLSSRCLLPYSIAAMLSAFLFSSGPATAATPPISLASSNWRFQIDRNDAGSSQSWWTRDLPGKIRLPGSMTENRLGDEVTSATPWVIFSTHLQDWYNSADSAPMLQPGHVKLPFWLTPIKYYMGAAWYQRDITIPNDWRKRRITLFLERTHWRTDVWIDDKPAGFRDSLSVPHEYDLGILAPGKHRLTIRVDNRIQVNVGVNAHSVSDHTQTNWNGIVGKIELRPSADVSLGDVQVYPDARKASAHVKATLHNPDAINASGRLQMYINMKGGTETQSKYVPATFDFTSTSTSVEADIPLNRAMRLWDEFNPNLYELHVTGQVSDGSATSSLAESKVPFGFRELTTSGTQFQLNGHPVFFRGTLECCIFPLTGYPAMDVGAWRRIMQISRAHGLNHLRFHSWCPPEAAFEAADEEGFYLSVECASWTNVGEDPVYDKWLYAESERIVKTYGNHPSFCMMLYGNEPRGSKNKKALTQFVNFWKKQDDRRLYSGGAGWPMIEANEFHITPKARIHNTHKGYDVRVNALPPETSTDYTDFVSSQKVPVINHEIGQWCVYPNFEERAKYTGVLRAYNFDIFANSLTRHHMFDQAHDFLIASGKLQSLLYKEEIESALRTPGMGGFQLLDLHDFPGQGTALVGVLDPFWDSKGYITAEEYHQFCGPVVPLARLAKRVFTSDENLTASVEIANYGSGPIPAAHALWTLTGKNNRVVASGKFPVRDLPLGSNLELGSISQSLAAIKSAQQLSLSVNIEGTDARNTWDIWVYPPKVNTRVPDDIQLTHKLDTAAIDRLQAGGKVLLIPDTQDVIGDTSGPISAGFTSIFWNTAWFPNEPPYTLGILCNPLHAALAGFPTEFHSNWQWWYLIHNSPVMLLEGLRPNLRPIVQMIDDWNTNRRLGYMFEGKYNGGRLLVCSFQLDSNPGDPVARQMLHSLLDYMNSDQFDPQQNISQEELEKVLKLSAH